MQATRSEIATHNARQVKDILRAIVAEWEWYQTSDSHEPGDIVDIRAVLWLADDGRIKDWSIATGDVAYDIAHGDLCVDGEIVIGGGWRELEDCYTSMLTGIETDDRIVLPE